MGRQRSIHKSIILTFLEGKQAEADLVSRYIVYHSILLSQHQPQTGKIIICTIDREFISIHFDSILFSNKFQID